MDFSELIKAADPQVFVDSIKSWVANLSINSVIMFIMMIFMIVGAVDRIRGNKKGYGEKFEEGFNAMGALAIAMAGVVAAAPVLALLLQPSSARSTVCLARTPPCLQRRFWRATWAATRLPCSWQKIRLSATMQA